MSGILRLLFLVLLLAGSHLLQAQNCASVTAGADDSICVGGASILQANYVGPAGTSTYAGAFIPYAPYPYTGGQVVLSNLDDAWSSAITLPFCFEFYGTSYSQIIIGTNGLISFDVAQANGICPWTINVAAPNPGLPLNSIMAPYHDVDPMIPVPNASTQINYQTYGTAPCRKFVVSWNEIAMYGNGCSSILSTSQAVLHETTYAIDIFIENKGVCNTWNNGAAIEGIQNATGSSACIFPGRNYPAQWSVANDGVRFIPTGPPSATFQWLDPSNNVVGTNQICPVNPSQTTTYTLNVILTSCNGQPITFTDQVTVYVIPICMTAAMTGGGMLCSNSCTGTLTITVNNGVPPYSYSWNPVLPPTAAQINVCPGVYTCIVTDAAGNTSSTSFTLTPLPTFTVTPTSTATICNTSTGAAAVTVNGLTGPYTYLWDTGDTTASISNLAAGIYSVIVTDTAGCADTVGVAVPPIGLNLTEQHTALLCNGDCNSTASVTVSNGIAPYTYNWLPYGGTNASASSLCAGSFTCTVVDAVNCTTAINVNIVSPLPIVVTPSSNQTVCDGESCILTVSVLGGTAPYTYTWNNNLPPGPTHTITPTQTSIYTVDVTDANGCSAPQQSTQVKVNPDPVADFSSTPAECPPAWVQFTNLTDTAITYSWDFGDPASGSNNTSAIVHPSHLFGQSGTYTVTLIATNQWGCADTIALPSVVVPASPTAQLSVASQLIVTMDPVCTFFNTSTGGDFYFIDFGDGDTMTTIFSGPYDHAYDSMGVYTVMLVATNSLGCTDTTWIEIVLEEPTTCWVPNAFTPNGNGENNEFMVYGINFREFELLIFDRWGLLIFSTNDIYQGWDGTYQGSKCQEDVYVWKLNYTDNAGFRHEEIGHVSLIR